MNSNLLTSVLEWPLFILMVAWPAWGLLAPRISRPDPFFFSITVDPSLRGSAAGHRILARFSRSVVLSGLVGLLVALGGLIALENPALRLASLLLGFVGESAGITFAFFAARRRVSDHRVAPSSQREAGLSPRRTALPGGWLAQAGPFLVLSLTAAWLSLHWNAIPARFPVHWGLDGKPNGWADKSLGSAFSSSLIGVMVCLLLASFNYGVARGVRRIHISGRAGQTEGRNLRIVLLMLLLMEYWVALLSGFASLVPLFSNAQDGSEPAWTSAAIMVATLGGLLFTVGVVVFAVRSGQGGWRLAAGNGPQPPVTEPAGDRTPDECWKGGLFYYNPEDSALWVEKRFGYGWTLNFANPRAWFVIGGILLFVVAVPGIGIVLARK